VCGGGKYYIHTFSWLRESRVSLRWPDLELNPTKPRESCVSLRASCVSSSSFPSALAALGPRDKQLHHPRMCCKRLEPMCVCVCVCVCTHTHTPHVCMLIICIDLNFICVYTHTGAQRVGERRRVLWRGGVSSREVPPLPPSLSMRRDKLSLSRPAEIAVVNGFELAVERGQREPALILGLHKELPKHTRRSQRPSAV